LTADECNDKKIQGAIDSLHVNICDKIGGQQTSSAQEELQDYYEPFELDMSKPEIDNYTHETCDALISAEVILPKGDVLVPA
jgi:hypothetical protein